MASGDFDPTDPVQPEAGDPVTAYASLPRGLAPLALGQAVAAVLMVSAGMNSGAWREDGRIVVLASLLVPPLVLTVSSFGIALRRGWGWWLTCAICFTQFFNLPVSLILWTVRNQRFVADSELFVFAVVVGVLAYLNRQEVRRFFRFRTPDGRPTRLSVMSPVVAGLAWAAVRLVRQLSASG